jgi:tRNA-dihydrouridine synthase
MITIHGRTRCQFYKGSADWAAIAKVKANVSVPVVANGDITGPSDAKQALKESNANGVMVGRGAQGRPWLLAQLAATLAGNAPQPAPTGADLTEIAVTHYEDTLSFYGKDLGSRVARKHLGWYMDTANTPRDMRKPILTERDTAVVLNQLPHVLNGDWQVAA